MIVLLEYCYLDQYVSLVYFIPFFCFTDKAL